MRSHHHKGGAVGAIGECQPAGTEKRVLFLETAWRTALLETTHKATARSRRRRRIDSLLAHSKKEKKYATIIPSRTNITARKMSKFLFPEPI